MEKKGKTEPEMNDQHQRGEFLLLQVSGKDMIKGKRESELRALKSQGVGTDVEAPGQLCLSSSGVQRTAVDGLTHANGSSELGRIFLLQVIVGMRPDKTSQVTTRREIVILPMEWQEEDVVKLSNKQYK